MKTFTVREEIKFFYDHFIDDKKNFEILKIWAKFLLCPAWFIRSIIVSCLIILLFPLFHLYFIYHKEIEDMINLINDQIQYIFQEFEDSKEQTKNL